ncbi:MAG: right-handed parallel beta-helix repeat-containing protein [candidate division SR1 bacterium]|nr:right-handed parallel beta-helix repeat-containing protein [candidate division SR1 bacterium]
MKKFLSRYLTIITLLIGALLYANVFAVNMAGIDTSLDTKIPVGFDAVVSVLKIQHDGKILVGGEFTTYKGMPSNYITRIYADGTKDLSLNIGTGFDGPVNTIAVQDDGKLLVGGQFNSYNGSPAHKLIRLNSGGTIDSSFNIGNGFNSYITALAIQHDGKIVVGGWFTAYDGTTVNGLVRLNADGSRDTSFLTGGSTILGSAGYVYAVAIDSNENILVGGDFDTYNGTSIYNMIVRLNSGGVIDTSFNTGSFGTGLIGGYARAIAIQNDGKIIAGGTHGNFIRLNVDGTKDTSFLAGSGFYVGSQMGIEASRVTSIAIQNDEKIVVGGTLTTYSGELVNNITRLNTDGTRDSSFTIGGGLDSRVNSIAIQNDGKILAGGYFYTYSGSTVNNIVSLNTSGTKNNAFDIGNGLNFAVSATAVQSNGSIIVIGGFNTYSGVSANNIVKLNADGTRNAAFTIGSGFANGYPAALAIQSDDKIIVGGEFLGYNGWIRNHLVRLSSGGAIDTTFNNGVGFNSTTNSIAIQNDGKIIVGGNFSTYNGTSKNSIVRLNTGSSIDSSFNIGIGFNSAVTALAIQSDGKIVVGGRFTGYNGIAKNHIVRLNTDGTIDNTFSIGSGFNNSITTLAIQNDGKILVGGDFTTYSGISTKYLTRLDSGGAIDPSFSFGGEGFSGRINGRGYLISAIKVQNNGKILVGGNFTLYNGSAVSNIICLRDDGSRYPLFDAGIGFPNDVYSITVQTGGRILVGGRFTSYQGVVAGYLIGLYGDSPFVLLPNSIDTGTVTYEFTSKGYINNSNQLSGATPISFEYTDGAIPFALDLKNRNMELILPKDIQFRNENNTSNYSGVMSVPIPYSVASVNNAHVDAAFKVGSLTEPLKLIGGVATLSIPVPTTSIGAPAQIYLSEDGGVSWLSQGFTTVITGNDGQPYVSFTTDKFSIFAITSFTGSFVINDGNSTTESKSVALNVSATPSVTMRFSNDNSTRSNRESYVTNKNWTLTGDLGSKTVYAQFDVDGNGISDIATTDSIEYVDTQGPTIPILLSPTSGTKLSTGTVNLLRSGSTDIGAGVSGYIYQVSTGATFTTFITSGFTSTTGISLNDVTNETYYRRISAIDNVGNVGGRSTSWSFIIDRIFCLSGSDNDNFLTGGFRNYNPTDLNIICALYGDGSGGVDRTAYTQNRSGTNCITGNLTVTGISPGTDTLPSTLTDNTIYVLESGTYIANDTKNMGTCTAIVGKGTAIIEGPATNTKLISSNTQHNWILDNLKLDRNRGANNSTELIVIYASTSPSITIHGTKTYSGYVGIEVSGSPYATIADTQVYDNLARGIMLISSSYGTINNTQSHNNDLGIYVSSSSYTTIHNNQIYNNNLDGISFSSSNSGTINDSQSSGNRNGIIFASSINGKIDNVQTYTNGTGICFSSSSYGTINNTQSYNNTRYGIYISSSHYTTINTGETYGNIDGIYYINSNYGTTNNSRSYNNSRYGIHYNSSSSGLVKNSDAYYNSSQGIYREGSTSNYNIISGSRTYNNMADGIKFNQINYSQIYNSLSYNNVGMGIYMYSTVNDQINNTQVYNNTGNGIVDNASVNPQINNSQIYNNKTNGIQSARTTAETINNSQVYNNNYAGIIYGDGINPGPVNMQVNNSQIYNNGGIGIHYFSNAYSGGINNSQIYNNGNYGISYLSGKNNNINSSQIYNNSGYGIYVSTSSISNYYYGDNKIFNNSGRNISGTISNFITGTDGLLGRKNGTLDFSPTMSRDYITNPMDSSNRYLLSRSGNFISIRGQKTFTGTTGIQYSYGSGILTQTQPVYYVGTTLIASGVYTTGNFIGSSVTKITGDLFGINPSIYHTYNTIITGIANNPATMYNIYGDLTNFKYGVNNNTSTGITFVSGNFLGKVIMQIYDPIYYFAMHFQSTTLLDQCGNRNNDQFITGTFRSSNPSSNKIICALYGDGSGGTDTTAYTKYRGTNTCSMENMSVIYLSGGGLNILPTTLSDNTIYVLSGGFWTVDTRRNMSNCSAIIGKGDVTIQSSIPTEPQSTMINANSTRNRILDNLKLDRNYTGTTGLNSAINIESAATSMTINNMQVYNASTSFGIQEGDSSGSYLIINNTQVYSGYMGIRIGSPYSIITNSQTFNMFNVGFEIKANSGIIDNCQAYNTFVGMRYEQANGNVLSNSLSYNNNYGVSYSGASNNIITNSQIYNNGSVYGLIYESGDNNSINNTRVYNNGSYGIAISSPVTNIKYYGYNRVFNNGTNLSGTAINFVTGSASDFPGLGRETGTIDTTSILSRDYLTNPRNNLGIYNSIRSGTFASLRGKQTSGFLSILPIIYSYGSGIFTQAQPVIYLTGSTLTPRGSFNASNYIGGDTPKITGDLTGISDYNTTNIIITGVANSPATMYNIYGDLTNFKYGVNNNTSTGITLLGGIDTARVITQLYDPVNYFATHFQKIATIDKISPSIPMLIRPTNQQVITTGNTNLLRSGGVDIGMGLSGYIYQVSTGSTFTTFITSGFTTTTGITLNGLANETYYRHVYAIDLAGNTGWRSSNWDFIVDTTNPIIIFTGVTPIDNIRTAANSFTAKLNLTELNLNEFKRTRSGSNYSIYDSGLLLMMNFDNVSALGETDGLIKDVSQYGNIGSGYGGVTRTGNGRWSGAYIGNGVDGRIKLTNKTGFQIITFTISAWIKPTSSTAPWGIFSTFYYGGASNYYGYALRLSTTNQISFITTNGGGLTNNEQILGSVVQTGVWTHLVVTYNGTTSSIYKNGVYETGKVQTTPIFYTGEYHADIGALHTDSITFGSYFSGAIDELRIYNRVLSSGEVTELYNSNLNKDDTDKWSFTISQSVLNDGIFRYTGFVNDLADNSIATGRNINRDATGPSAPILLAPTSGTETNSGTVNFLRSGSTDLGIGVSGYMYQVSTGAGFTSLITSGFTTTTGISLTNLADEIYYRRVSAIDILGNASGRSNIWNFVVNVYPCLSGWNNDNYITTGFRNSNPNSRNIICALYGSGLGDTTAYTQDWSGRDSTQCTGMKVIYTGNLITSILQANTIYVLTGTTSINNGSIDMTNCSSVISNQATGTILYSNNWANQMLYNNNKHYIIIDNITINGSGDGNGGSHASNKNGIYLYDSLDTTINNIRIYNNQNGIESYFGSNNTINNVQTHNNDWGVELQSGANNIISNTKAYMNQQIGIGVWYEGGNNSIKDSQSYNNGRGIQISYGGNNNVNNVEVYNNIHMGIALGSGTSNNSINNAKVYNHTNNVGIYIVKDGSNNTINNVQTYNNGWGLVIGAGGYNNSINNIQAYNNTVGILITSANNNTINNAQTYNDNWGVAINTGANNNINNIQAYNCSDDGIGNYFTSPNNTYYGNIALFNNGSDIAGSRSVGSTSDFPLLGRNSGTIITTGIMSWDYITNPINNNNKYLLNRSGTFTSLIGQKTFTGTSGMQYSYGSSILTQAQPVVYSGVDLILSGTFDSTKYIGSDTTKLTGNLLGVISITNHTGALVTGTVNNILTDTYNLFGNIISYKIGQTINTNTGIVLTNGDGNKRIITQIYSSNYFATHFENDSYLDQTPPTATVEYSPISGARTSGDVLAILTGYSEKIVGINFTGHLFTGNGTFTFTFSDLAGNPGITTGTVWRIDKAPPTFSGVTTGTTYVTSVSIDFADDNPGVTATVNGNPYMSGTSIVGDGTYTLLVTDIAGNTTGATFTINTFIDCASRWNNDNFITGGFRDNNPSTQNIICALYGSGASDKTAYTNPRISNTCNPSVMSVEYINNYATSGADSIPEYLTGNTIYVLFSGSHVTSRMINVNNCSAIVGSGNATIYFSGYTFHGPFGGVFFAQGKQHAIIDNVSTDGTSGGPLSTHQPLYAGVYIYQSSNITMNQIKSYNYSYYGIAIYKSDNALIANSHTYNNYDGIVIGGEADSFGNTVFRNQSNNNIYGIVLSNVKRNNIIESQLYQNSNAGIYLRNYATENTISNSKIFNNSYGIESAGNSGNTINNTQIYNNGRGAFFHDSSNNSVINNSQIYDSISLGMRIANDSNDNIINNCQIYNNNGAGVNFEANTHNNRINDTEIYNNNWGGVLLAATSSGNTYYGSAKIFGNRFGNIVDENSNETTTGFTRGSSLDFPGVFTGGILDTGGTMSRDYITNPIDNNGNYFLPWTGDFIDFRSLIQKNILPANYSYGSGILLQKQPVIYSGTDLILSGSFDPTKYIGSDTTKYTGSLSGLPIITDITGFTVTANANSNFISNYSLFGDIGTFKTSQSINTSTGIYLATGDGNKHVITQIFGGDYFATHFETNIYVDQTPATCTLTSLINSGFLPLSIDFTGSRSTGTLFSGLSLGDGNQYNNFTGIYGYTYTGVGAFTATLYVYKDWDSTITGSCSMRINVNPITYIIKAWPEKRSQTTVGTTLPNFRMTGAKVGIYSGHTLLYTGIISLGRGGTGELSIGAILSGAYNITFEGISHARSMLSGITIDATTRTLDFTTGNNIVGAIFSNAFSQFNPYTGYYQYAGDFSTPNLTKDETIMGADYSALVPYILVPFSPNYGFDKFDLNADGVYNSSDVDIIISHWITSTSGHGVTSGGRISF